MGRRGSGHPSSCSGAQTRTPADTPSRQVVLNASSGDVRKIMSEWGGGGDGVRVVVKSVCVSGMCINARPPTPMCQTTPL